MHIVELELKLLMAANNHERLNHQTPKIQERSGRFMRSLLKGHSTTSVNAQTVISSPTSKSSLRYFAQSSIGINSFIVDFRHLISVCHNPPSLDHNSSPTIPPSSTSSSSPISCPMPSNSSITVLSNKSFNSPYDRSFSSNSTPSTPNMSRLRTLTCTYIRNFGFSPEYSHYSRDKCNSIFLISANLLLDEFIIP